MPNLFLTNEQYLLRFDGRWVGKNINDDGTAATIAQLEDTGTDAGAKLEILIGEAEEEVLSAAMVAARYSIDELVTYGGQLLKGIIAGVATGKILARRMRAVSDEEKLSASVNKANWYLENLRRGERIFALVPNVPEAGLPGTATQLPVYGVDPPLFTDRAPRYFGVNNPLGGQSW